MFLKAARDWEIDPAQSFMIGDRMSDLQAGQTAGCAAEVLVLTGYGMNEQDAARTAGFRIAENLLDAVNGLLKK